MKSPILLVAIIIAIIFQGQAQINGIEVDGGFREHLRMNRPGTGFMDLTIRSPYGLMALDSAQKPLLILSSHEDVNGDFVGKASIGTTSVRSMLTLRGPNDYHDGPNILLFGNSSDQAESGRIRFVEGTAANNYRGGYIHYDGTANRFHIGVHNASDNDKNNDFNALSINRFNGAVGMGTPNPFAKIHLFEDNAPIGHRSLLALLESKFAKRPTLMFGTNGTNIGFGIEYDGTLK